MRDPLNPVEAFGTAVLLIGANMVERCVRDAASSGRFGALFVVKWVEPSGVDAYEA